MATQSLRLSDFDYCLPKELIAQYPCPKRQDSRLLVLDRAKRKISHRRFKDIVEYFSSSDCLILNNTKVIPARIIGRREKFHSQYGGARQEIFLLENLSCNIYRVLARPAKKLTLGAKILFAEGAFSAEVLSDEGMIKTVKFCGNAKANNFWQQYGQVPLPPYIKRKPEEADKKRYQTVYAKEEGATAAPTAGLHFTKEILKDIQKKGVNILELTLHINYGTFAPVKCEDISKHKMHQEYFILPSKTKQVINVTKANNKKVFAVGTTSLRVLETWVRKSVTLKEDKGWTDLFIYPPYQFKVIDSLLTNFHFPKSTLLMLVSAFAGKELIFQAYQEAIKKQYRLFSYGDAMLII